ncbi:MAG: Smr/MutS family protein [Gammaproteobacteria bacterium]
MTNEKKPSPEDIELFRRSIGPVRRLASDTVPAPARHRTPRLRARPFVRDSAPLPGFSRGHLEEVGAGETLAFARPGLQQRLLHRLRRGQLPVGAELDLHGMTIPEAENEVARFLAYCSDRHIRCARIIHGKGYGSRAQAPLLKNRINNWLRQHHEVLAFHSARPEHGGSGAVHVLLRTRR